MDSVTVVMFDNALSDDTSSVIFRTSNQDDLVVKSFENGIVTVAPRYGCSATSFASLIAGCFSEYSNFKEELFKAFDCNRNTSFKGIKFVFNGVNFLATKENADVSKICEKWYMGLEPNAKQVNVG